MKIVVPDASVILKWIVPDPIGEEDVQAALALREAANSGKCQLKVPSLWLYEVGNTLTRRFASHAMQALEALLAFGMQEIAPDGAWLTHTITLTQSFGVTFYDAAYHALALREKGVFVTADVHYASRTASAGAVMTLTDWAEEQ